MTTTQSITRLDLEHILSPTSSEAFFHETWETKSFHVERDDESHYAGLLSLRDVDQIIAFSRPKFADLSAFHDQSPSGSTYVRGVLADQPSQSPATNPGLAELRQVYDQGKSLVIMGMQQRWPAVAELCRNLEVVFHCPVHANMYLTPAGSQAFAAHFDPHEVFILQLEGAKHWRLYDRTELLPLASDKSGAPALPMGAVREVCLKPGDLLYIPRGHVHDAFTADTFSLHLTVGINVYRWADLLHHAVTCASRNDSQLRESIPGGALPARSLPGGNSKLKERFKHLLASLSGSDCDRLFDEATGSLADQFFGQLPMLPGTQFSSPVDLEQVRLDTMLERHPQAICRVVERNGGVAIEFPGNRVGGPPRIASALRFVADTVCFAVQDLPDDLNVQAKVVLARRLVREGLLAPVAQPVAAQPADIPEKNESPTRETTTIGSHVRSDTPGRASERRVRVPAHQAYERKGVES
jgi:hypothetical protein